MSSESSSSSLGFSDVRSGLPAQLDDVFRSHVSPLDLLVLTVYKISVLEIPFSMSLWLIIIEVALEESAVWIEPLSIYHLATFPAANILHASLFENICSSSILLATFPLSRVDIFIFIYHDSFSVPLAIFPMTVILSYSSIGLLPYTMLIVIEPGSLIGVWWNFSAFWIFSFFLRVICVCSVTLSYLY